MSAELTRKRILDASVELFNEMGFLNVRLQHICDKTIISLGNITYHYRTKDDIILAIWRQIRDEQRILMAEFRTLPLFEDIERFLYTSFQLQQKYTFFYKDTLDLVRAYPDINGDHQTHILWQEQQLVHMFVFNASRGAFVKEKIDVFFDSAAANWLWMLENWMHRRQIRGEDYTDYNAMSSTLWIQLMPFFSDQGRQEFQQLQQLKINWQNESKVHH